MLRSSQSPQATCQFPMRGLMKNVLTVTGSGCVALGHPARPPKWLPETGEPRRTPLSNPAAPKWRRRRWNEQATPIPSRKRTAGASRVTRVPVANNATGTVSRRCREQAKEIAAAPGAAARHGLEFMFEAQVFRRQVFRGKVFQGKAFPAEAKVRSGWHGDVPTFAGCSVDTDRRARSPRSVPFTDNRAGPRFPSPMRRGANGTPPVVRLQNGQQNAHRRDPSRGDPGGRSARQSRRGIRLRVRTP